MTEARLDEARRLTLTVDGGGTTTQACLVDQSNAEGPEVVGEFEVSSLSCKSSTPSDVLSALLDLRAQVDECMSAIDGGAFLDTAMFALSGLDSGEDFERMRVLLQDAGFAEEGTQLEKCRFGYKLEGSDEAGASGTSSRAFLASDALLALFAAGESAGSVLISGTGSVALRAEESGEVTRFGGWGYRVSDIGSGYWIGSEFIRAALACADAWKSGQRSSQALRATSENGRSADVPQVVSDAMEIVGASSLQELFEWPIAHDSPKDYSALAKAAIKSGSPEANDVCKRAAGELAKLASLATGTEGKLAISGGILSNEEIIHLLREALPEGVQIVPLKMSLVMGGLGLAASMSK